MFSATNNEASSNCITKRRQRGKASQNINLHSYRTHSNENKLAPGPLPFRSTGARLVTEIEVHARRGISLPAKKLDYYSPPAAAAAA
jgi:hypothetical protein